MTRKEFDLIKYVINDGLKKENVNDAVRLVALYSEFELINYKVRERLYNCIRNGIYLTCSMFDEIKGLEND